MSGELQFGYPWWLGYGHLVFAGIVFAIFAVGWVRKWSIVPMVLIGLVAAWALAAFVVVRMNLNVNAPMALPTEKFLASGKGRVLDLGAGTGRSTIMVLEARPQTSVVALDLFGDSYRMHFGKEESGQERLMKNLQIAGVADRATIQQADMRKLPFEEASFDAIVSAYAIDHLNRDGIDACLQESQRVLKPGGEFLMAIIAKDRWLKFTFGPLLLHSGTRPVEWWTQRVEKAGLQVVETGTPPATLYVLARKP